MSKIDLKCEFFDVCKDNQKSYCKIISDLWNSQCRCLFLDNFIEEKYGSYSDEYKEMIMFRAVRRFRAMVGTEFSGQEKDKRYVESALLWREKRDDMQSQERNCSCGEGLELRDFYFSEKQIIFVYKCDFCFESQLFKYKRGN